MALYSNLKHLELRVTCALQYLCGFNW